MNKDSLLWQINKGEGPASYLFGTMHVRDDIAFQHVERVLKYLSRCEALLTEIDLDEAKDKIQPQSYLLPEKMTLQSLVGEKKFNKMLAVLQKSFDFDLAQCNRLLPLLTINKISESLLKDDHSQPLDSFLWSEGKRLKIACAGIESLGEQLEILQEMDINLQVKMLKDLCGNVSKFARSIERMSKMYLAEDIKGLYKLTKKSLGSFRNILLYNRNTIMADRISERMNGHSSFYAIGAAHLAGDKGILALLKRKNLTLKPI